MTFAEWCLLDADDGENLIEVHVNGRLRFRAGEAVPMWQVEIFKPMELAEDPILENGIWKVHLKGAKHE